MDDKNLNLSPQPGTPLQTSPHNHHHGHHKYNRRPRQQRPTVPPGHVALRLLCPQSAIGGVIGNNGAVVSQLRRDTGAKIHCENPAPGSEDGLVFVVGSAGRDRTIVFAGKGGPETAAAEEEEEEEHGHVSCAQEALVRVFERIWTIESQSENGGGGGRGPGLVLGRLVAHSSQIKVLIGKGGTHIVKMRKETYADIRILPAPQLEPRHRDEVIQISGSVLAVKKALVAVSSCLQDHPPLENGPAYFSRHTEASAFGESRNVSDPQAEFFPNLGSLLRQTSCDNSGVSDKDAKGMRQEVVFRLLCSNDSAGSVIGRKGAIVRGLENETGATIRFSAPTAGPGDRVVTISASEDLESQYSPAQNAVILVFARAVEGDIEKGFLLRFSQGVTVTAKLLVSSDLVGSLSENEGKVISEIRDVSGADIRILDGAPDNQVVKITGEYRTVQNALFQVTSTLRDYLLSHEVLNEVRPRNSFGWVTEPTVSGSHQSLGVLPDVNDEALLTCQTSRLGLSQGLVSFSPESQLPQAVDTGHAKYGTNGPEALATFGQDLEVKSGHKLAIVTNTTLEIVVSKHAFGSIYGEEGANLGRLKEISGAKVEVRDPRPGESEGKIVISGTPDQTLAAQSLLQAFIQTARKL